MSKRFGRNQRRAMREAHAAYITKTEAFIGKLMNDIAKRDQAIADLRVGDWMQADQTHPLLTDLVLSITEQEVREGTDRRGLYRRATITATVHDERGIQDLMSGASPIVEWKGVVWWVKECSVDRRCDRWAARAAYMDSVIEMEALPRPVPRDVQYIFGREKTTQIEHRAVGGSRFHSADPRPEVRIP